MQFLEARKILKEIKVVISPVFEHSSLIIVQTIIQLS